MDAFTECGLPVPPKNVNTRWLLVMNQIIYMRKHDYFFVGYSNENYPSQLTSSLLLDNDHGVSDSLGLCIKENPKYSNHYQSFLQMARGKNIDISLFSEDNFRNYMYFGRLIWPLWQAILYFEKNDSSFISIYSIFQ